MQQIHSFHSVPRSSSPQNYHHSHHHQHHQTFQHRERNLVLDLGKHQTAHSPFGIEGKSPYPSPPMSEATPPHDRSSPARQQPPRQQQQQQQQQQQVQQVQYSADSRRASMPQSPYDIYRDARHPLADPYPRGAYYSMAPVTAPLLSAPSLPAIHPPSTRSPFVHQQTPVAPSRPVAKRAKSHVSAACTNCKKAHLACDVERPCNRCVCLNKQDTCKDVPHKKRGRPRLKEERGPSFEVSNIPEAYRGSDLLSPRVSPTVNPSATHFSPSQYNLPYLQQQPPQREDGVPRRFVSSPYQRQSEHEHLSRSQGRISQSPREQPPTPGAVRAVGIFSTNFTIIHSNDEFRLRYDLDSTDGYKRLLYNRMQSQVETEKLTALRGKIEGEIRRIMPDYDFTLYPESERIVFETAKRRRVEEWASNLPDCLKEWTEVLRVLHADGSAHPTHLTVRLYRTGRLFFLSIEMSRQMQQQQQGTYESMPVSAGPRDFHPPLPSPLPLPTPLHRLSLPGDIHLPNSPASAAYSLQRTLPYPFDSQSPRYPPPLSSPVPHTPLTAQPILSEASTPIAQTPREQRDLDFHLQQLQSQKQPQTQPPPQLQRPQSQPQPTPPQQAQRRPLSAPGQEFRLPPLKAVQKRTRSERDDESEGGASGDDRPKEKVRKLNIGEMLNTNSS